MRRAVVSILLLGLAGGLGFTVSTRERSNTPVVVASKPAAAQGGEAAGGDAGPVASGDAGPAKPEPKMDRPLQIVALGWDLLVPGLIANGGLTSGADSAFTERGLELRARAVSTLAQVQAALAAGGDGKDGADIAVVPLPALAVTYEDLRALDPQLFWVVGMSRGRDALYGKSATALRKPPRGRVKMIGERGDAATFLGLFALDLAGVDVARVKLVKRTDAADLAALDRDHPGSADLAESRELLLTTSDATELIPYVAIAPRGFLDANADAVAAFIAGWIDGIHKLRQDVPAAAREVSKLEGTPSAVVLIKRLGHIEFVDLAGNARLLGLSGRGAVTIESLLAESFRLWRRVGALTAPTPAAAPISGAAVTALVLSKPPLRSEPEKAAAREDDPAVVEISMGDKDLDEVVHRVGLVAGVFSRSVFEVGVGRDQKKTESVIQQARERFDLAADRLRAAAKSSRRRKARIAVLPIP
jgi:hypothetical protein